MMLATVNLAATEGAMVLANTWGNPDRTGGKGPEFGKAAPVGLAVILGLLLAIMLLARSMNRRIKSLRANAEAAEKAGVEWGAQPDGFAVSRTSAEQPVGSACESADGGTAADRPDPGRPD